MAKKSRKRPREVEAPTPRFDPRWACILLALFVIALVPRVWGGLHFGKDLDGPGTFSMINYDEAGSCRAILGGRSYPTFIGHQILAIASLTGDSPPASSYTPIRAKSACQTWRLIRIHRLYSAVTGALTVVLLALLGLLMWPTRPQIAWTAGGLLAVSNLHVAQSHWGTADAPQVFFVTLLTSVLAFGIARRKSAMLWISPLFLIAAIWAKWYFFAVLAYAALLPSLDLRRNGLKILAGLTVAGLVGVALIGWENITDLVAHRAYLFWGNDSTPFGTGYANIGSWRRWIRNGVNLPVVHVVGLGLPACIFAVYGLRGALKDRENRALWLLQLPAVLYAVYMFALGPVTYYRHYLPFFPPVALLAAYGLWESRWASRRLFLVFFFVYPLLLTVDSEWSYYQDPRRAMRPWYANHPGARIFTTFYVVPPRTHRTAAFSPDLYAEHGLSYLGSAQYLILSENWYDTSFPNELNGPIAWRPEWAIKTKPEHVRMYRRILALEDPYLQLEAEYDLFHFMPEFILHRLFYGSFQLFVGDLKLFRVLRRSGPAP